MVGGGCSDRFKGARMEHIVLTANILWQIWKARNKMAFEQQRSGANDIVQRAQQEWLEYEDVLQQERQSTRMNGLGIRWNR